MTYVALLRGINVNGRRMIKMERLRSLFESLGFENVKTYIQSGNVLFSAPSDNVTAIREQIEHQLFQEFGEDVPVMIRSIAELEGVIQQNPYGTKVFIAFLSDVPAPDDVQTLYTYNGVDEVQVTNREVYIRCHNSFHKTVFSNQFIEKKLGLSSTVRNWNTALKLVSLADDLSTP